jgi:hypothetical protein
LTDPKEEERLVLKKRITDPTGEEKLIMQESRDTVL